MANITKVTGYTISQTQGDDWKVEIPVQDSNNDPFDWTGYTNAESEMRNNCGDALLATFTVTLSTGFITLELPKATTVNLVAQVNKYDIQVDFPDARTQTIISGDFIVECEVTES